MDAPLHRTDPSLPKTGAGSSDSASAASGGPIGRGAEIDVTIEKLVYGGDGLARRGTVTILVPFAAAGDHVRIRVTQSRRNFARGEVVALLESGPSRREARCRHFGVCGGCQLQHVAREEQLRAKAEFVRESLRRLGGIDWTAEIPVRAGPEYGWRTRAEVHSRRGHVGYYRAATHEIVDVEECPILVPAAEEFVRALRANPPRGPLRLAVGDEGRVASGSERTRQRIGGFEFESAADAFQQANRGLVETLVAEAVGGASGELAVDLYAGAGLFSLPLARAFREVVSVEGRTSASRQAASNAAANGVANVRFVAEAVERWLATTAARPDLVLLDPPRAGAGEEVAAAIARRLPAEVVYVSCDPATLARDLRVLVGSSYRLASVVALDMFPQSYHVETVVRLRRE